MIYKNVMNKILYNIFSSNKIKKKTVITFGYFMIEKY